MRILKTVQAYYPFQDRGGPVVKVRAIARGLARRGHRITILTADLGVRERDAPGAVMERGRWGWQASQDGVETIYLPTWARYRALTLNPGVLNFCLQSLDAFDLAHIYGLYDLLGSTVGLACLRRGLPYVIEPMGMFRPIIRNIALKKLYHRILGRRLVRGARRVIATSLQEKNELVDGGIPERQIIVRRNGIEVPDCLPTPGSFRQKWGIPPNSKLILFLGRLVSKKSPDMILEAFARWRQDAGLKQSAVLVLAGPEEGDGYYGKLKSLAERLGVAGSVLFTGPLYDDDKWAAFGDADLFVLPSQHENFGNTAAESVACGTPVIVTDRCGIAPLVNQRAGMVIPHDVQQLRAALAVLLEDHALQDRYRAGCAEVKRGLSWDEPLAQMEALYPQLAGAVAGQ